MELPKKFDDAVRSFSSIPGIGEKTALRQILFLTSLSSAEITNFGNSINLLSTLNKCENCGLFAEVNICEICSSDRIESKTICIIESISDCLAIEKSGHFQGTYYVLGGVLNPLLGVGPEELKIDQLVKRLIGENVENVILAVNPSVEGDATCSYLNQVFPETVKVERIGFGIPMGGSLEYLDSMTISKALENRRKM